MEGRILEESAQSLRKPPAAPKMPLMGRKQPLQNSVSMRVRSVRSRSASTGRDKKSELQARYWALLFDNLKRAINEIYQTVECYENLSSCQETILVLENYIRDFKALAEWFRVSWDYESTPLPHRPHSLAWEVRKSNPVPKVRTRNLSSPVISGKSSPNYSGKNSPCSAAGEEKRSQRAHVQGESKVAAKPAKKIEPPEAIIVNRSVEESKIEGTPERENELEKKEEVRKEEAPVENDVVKGLEAPFEETDKRISMNLDWNELMEQEEAEKTLKLDQSAQTDLEDDHLTLAMYLEKHNIKGFYQGNPEVVEEVAAKIDPAPPPEITPPQPPATQMSSPKPNSPQPPALQPATSQPIPSQPTSPRPAVEVSEKKDESTKKVPAVKEPPKRSPTSSIVVCREENRNKSVPVRKMPANPPPRVFVARKPITSQQSFHIAKSSSTPTAAAPRGSTIQKSSTVSNIQRTGRLPTVPKTIENRQRFPGVPTNTARRISARSSTMIDFKNSRPASQKGLPGRSSGKYSQEDMMSSSSTLKASSEHISGVASHKSSRGDLSYRKSEPKSLPTDTNDGWLTVKSRSRRSSLHWSNRFNQPSGYASLPILSLLDETPAEENREENTLKSESIPEKGKPIKTKSGDSGKNQRISPPTKPKVPLTKASVPAAKASNQAVKKVNGIVRQKSDLSRNKTLHSGKERSKKNVDKLIEVKTPEPDDDEISKVDMNIQTLLAEDLSSITINLSSCDEMDDKDLEESDDDQKKLLEEQENLERQIRELENTEIDVDTETDETDCEVLIDTEDLDLVVNDGPGGGEEMDFFDENMTLEMKYQSLLSDMSSGERLETLATLQAFVARHPGRAQELHQKLSSPSRRRSLHETLKKYQAKQTRAQEKREALQKEKTQKIQQLLARVEDVKAAKQQLIEEKRLRMEERLHRAAENRTQYLKDKVKKAHDEEEKLKEIAFIKSLEAQNKRLDIIESSKEHEGRLQDLEQERQKRVEEKAAKEAAAERRRLELEQERQRRLEQMWETKREREKRVGKLQEQKEKMRQEIAREKARDREERLQALQAQKLATTEELQRRIIQKQQESARRHEENIEHIRQRAQELGIPNRNTDDQALNAESSCDGDLSSTVSDVSIEPNKASRKKLKRLRQKLSDKTSEYLAEMPPLASHFRRDSEVPKILNIMNKGGGPQGMERPLGQLLRLVAKAQAADFHCMLSLNALELIVKVVEDGIKPHSEYSKKAVVLAVQLYRNLCSICPQIARHAILGNTILSLLDALLVTLQCPEEKSTKQPVELSTELMLACTVALSPTFTMKQSHPKLLDRLPDVMSYAVLIGLIETLTRRCTKIHESVESHQSVVLSLLATLGLLTKFAEICPKGPNDPTKFLSLAQQTELFGSIAFLHSTIVPIGECIPPRTVSLAAATFNLIVTLANADLGTFQKVLSEEVISLKFLDIIAILLKYCGPKSDVKGETQAVIVDLLSTLGYFCVNNSKNQNLIITEQLSVVKSIVKLPNEMSIYYYPTLATLIWKNEEAKDILSREFDVESLGEYQKSALAKKNKLLNLLNNN
ncbi:S phase cyclin A-associated protein in the endoplasmic reticulum [Lutzomyia longipalpis]|uniref:S phase cyclin A-associated protein in the endoplasmic reticulum n=1 Tax=Lutzomyia longipalpis TaxID=7200 RepID=UPI002483AB28|nr:S phase cyclin A-associated protein in the endoplasmic reticulum [Lutzomyia longipalpis]